MEALGQKLKQARLARKITLEEASRVTKIRPARIQEIEEEDFSSFSSLAYAKGFLLIYGKFLDVDVTPYLDAFETSDRMTVDGYSYLQDGGPTAPPPIVRRQPTKRPSLVPFLDRRRRARFRHLLVKLFLDIQRIAPPRSTEPAATMTATRLRRHRANRDTRPNCGAARRAGGRHSGRAKRPCVPTATPDPCDRRARPNRKCAGRSPSHPEDIPASQRGALRLTAGVTSE